MKKWFFLLSMLALVFNWDQSYGKHNSSGLSDAPPSSPVYTYPVNKKVPFVPGVVIVKRSSQVSSGYIKSALEKKLSSIGVFSVRPMFKNHRDDETGLSKIEKIELLTGDGVFKPLNYYPKISTLNGLNHSIYKKFVIFPMIPIFLFNGI